MLCLWTTHSTFTGFLFTQVYNSPANLMLRGGGKLIMEHHPIQGVAETNKTVSKCWPDRPLESHPGAQIKAFISPLWL